MIKFKTNKAQSLLEYLFLLSIIAMVLFAMNTFTKRTYQSMIKAAADQIGNQADADQNFNSLDGYLTYSEAKSDIRLSKDVVERSNYRINTIFDDFMEVTTTTVSNLGFTPEN